MALGETQNQINLIKTRRPHHKSRSGCVDCKRRRIKCDERIPSCTRCVLSLKKCIYLRAPPSTTKHRNDRIFSPNSSYSGVTLSSSPSSPARQPQSLKATLYSSLAFAESHRCSDGVDAPEGISGTDLYHHYLQHTSRTLSHAQKDQWALQIGMPTLALRSNTVFHSLVAVSAASLCCDMISKESPPDLRTVKQVLMTGYWHYNLASKGMREYMSWPDILKPEPLLASAVLLVPFATASQLINHWISSMSESQKSHKLLPTTPRDVIIITRGMQAMLKTLDSGSLSPDHQLSLEDELAFDVPPPVPDINTSTTALAPSRTHAMFNIIATTSASAYIKLQQRLDSTFLNGSKGIKDSLSACSAAFSVLKEIRTAAFCGSSPNDLREKTFQPRLVSLPQVAPWLRSLAGGSEIPTSTGPLTRFFLTFYFQTPQAYIDLVLPLLDQRVESSLGATTHNFSADLTMEQALALDIYAHWSVLMFLAEEESWWIGNLPFVTLSGLVKKYSDEFVTRLWPKTCTEQEQWWPVCMLNILREIKRSR